MSPHPNKPLNQYDDDDWRDYYRDPLRFAQLFKDYESLKEQDLRCGLSTSQTHQLEVIEELIELKLA